MCNEILLATGQEGEAWYDTRPLAKSQSLDAIPSLFHVDLGMQGSVTATALFTSVRAEAGGPHQEPEIYPRALPGPDRAANIH